MKNLSQSLTLMGYVKSVDLKERSFIVRCRSNDEIKISVGPTTYYTVLRNLDGLDRDRVPDPSSPATGDGVIDQLRKYIRTDLLIAVEGIYQEFNDKTSFEARNVHLLHSDEGAYLFEETHWWLSQISRMSDEWLEDLFDSTRSYKLDDFAKLYRTNLNILGGQTDDQIQECATMSRLIYGLSSAYLLTGAERYFLAAKAGVEYQRQTFRSLSHDSKYCFWAFGRRQLKNGSKLIIPSENDDDRDTIPLYEQIYAIAGLAQYYRITQDWEVLEDIRRTVTTFNDFYLDDEKAKAKGFPGHGGYFSHLDFATMRPDTPKLGRNRLRKNWNSVGDHIPAYLTNLVLALDPLPQGPARDNVAKLRDTCRDMLDMTSKIILERLPDPDERVPYVNERFHADFTPDHEWGWQQNRAIVGHNLKIAWNLTRCANYFYYLERENSMTREDVAKYYHQRAESSLNLARKLGNSMAEVGLDQIRGGVFDAVEREPSNGMPIQFTWGNTKDFWQQEQGVLAYLILHGATEGDQNFLQLSRELAGFWNLFFLDHDNRGVFFRVTENGLPVVQGAYAQKGSHSVAGYHSFELNYLAHLYMRAYVSNAAGTDDNFCLYFRPSAKSGQHSINVLPDFMKPGTVQIASVRVNGIKRPDLLSAVENFQVPLNESDMGCDVIVEFTAGEKKAKGSDTRTS
jgi:hypothetical protein